MINPNDIPTPLTDAKEYAPPLQSLVDADFTRTIEHSLNEFCALFGFPITVCDNAGTAQGKLAAALGKAGTLERENAKLKEEVANLQIALTQAQNRLRHYGKS